MLTTPMFMPINCQFCSFYRPPGHDETYTQSFEEISQRINELEDIGGSRILMQGGVNPDLEFSWYLDLISYLVKNHPNIHLDCFSPIEIEGIAEVSGMTTLEVLTQLQAVGLHGLPGGGAEMLVEEVRKDISPKKGQSRQLAKGDARGTITRTYHKCNQCLWFW